jgi:hypothetical protein
MPYGTQAPVMRRDTRLLCLLISMLNGGTEAAYINAVMNWVVSSATWSIVSWLAWDVLLLSLIADVRHSMREVGSCRYVVACN